MSVDGFITCLTLLVGLYTIAPTLSKLRARLLGWRLWLPSLIFFGIINYLLFFENFGAPCVLDWCSDLQLDANSSAANDLAFAAFIAWLLTVFWLFRHKTIPIRNYDRFRDLVEKLLADRRYGELVDIIEVNSKGITQRAGRSHWFQKLIDAVRSHGVSRNEWAKFSRRALPEPSKPSIPNRIWNSSKSLVLYGLKPVGWLVPKEDRAESSARLIIRRIATNEAFTKFVAQERPAFALEIMSSERMNYYDFSDRALTYMIEAPGGPLRQELWENAGFEGHFYYIDPANVILHFLFNDMKMAEKMEVYRPIGNYGISRIDDLSYRNFLNTKPRDFEKVKKSDSLFLMCNFFDIMIRESARQNIEWHMWLFYMNIAVGRVVGVMDIDADEYDPDAEFPNFGHYIIYTIFSNLCDWVQLFEHLDDDAIALKIESTEARHENGHIVKSAILSIGICLRELLQSEKITDDFIAYILEIVLRVRKSAMQSDQRKAFAEALTNSIIEGGPSGFAEFQGERLAICFDKIDHIDKYDHRDLGEILRERYS